MHVAEQLRGMCELRCPDLLTHALANPNSCPTPDCVADDSSPCSGTDALAGSSGHRRGGREAEASRLEEALRQLEQYVCR